MDMWPDYIHATLACVPNAEHKIAFDRFHMVKHLGEAVDRVWRREHKALRAAGDSVLTGSKYIWLTNREPMSAKQRKQFRALKNSSRKTSRAWARKETAQNLWSYVRRTWTAKAWQQGLSCGP